MFIDNRLKGELDDILMSKPPPTDLNFVEWLSAQHAKYDRDAQDIIENYKVRGLKAQIFCLWISDLDVSTTLDSKQSYAASAESATIGRDMGRWKTL